MSHKKHDGNFEWLKARPGFVLAGMEEIKYKQAELTLEEGEVFFTYTDGVTEALNKIFSLYKNPYVTISHEAKYNIRH